MPKSFFDAYRQHMPKTEPVGQHELRRDLYEVFHYLNHTVLFGVSTWCYRYRSMFSHHAGTICKLRRVEDGETVDCVGLSAVISINFQLGFVHYVTVLHSIRITETYSSWFVFLSLFVVPPPARLSHFIARPLAIIYDSVTDNAENTCCLPVRGYDSGPRTLSHGT